MSATSSVVTTPFDRESVQVARKAIEDALSALNLGFEVKLGRITFSRDSFRASLEAKLNSAVAAEQGASKGLLEMACKRHGIDPAHKPNIPATGVVELVGYNSRAPKYPWQVMHPNGTIYRYPTDMVIAYWGGKISPGALVPPMTLASSL